MRLLLIVLTLVALVSCAFLAGCDNADSQEPVDFKATAGWSPPTYGTPVVQYVLQHQIETAEWTFVGTTEDTLFSLTIPYAASSKVRVAGVDAEGRQGPWSLPSNPFNPSESMPGMPVNPRLY